MNILITGANGQLGNEMRLLSRESHKDSYFFTDVAELDKTKEKRDFQFEVPYWKESLTKCINKLKNN